MRRPLDDDGPDGIMDYIFLLGLEPEVQLLKGANLKVQMSLRFFNWTDPTCSINRSIECDFSADESCCYHCIEPEEMPSFLDEDGVLVVQVLKIQEIPTPPNPPQINNDNN